MKLQVIVLDENKQAIKGFDFVDEDQAKKKALELVEENEGNVYIEFYRSSDGQSGYLNRDGFSVTGQAW